LQQWKLKTGSSGSEENWGSKPIRLHDGWQGTDAMDLVIAVVKQHPKAKSEAAAAVKKKEAANQINYRASQNDQMRWTFWNL
jgi:hypothetical protein